MGAIRRLAQGIEIRECPVGGVGVDYAGVIDEKDLWAAQSAAQRPAVRLDFDLRVRTSQRTRKQIDVDFHQVAIQG